LILRISILEIKRLPDLYAFVCLEGLTDKMRADFNIMKDLASHTRLSPEQRESSMEEASFSKTKKPSRETTEFLCY